MWPCAASAAAAEGRALCLEVSIVSSSGGGEVVGTATVSVVGDTTRVLGLESTVLD